jgi:predicted Zn-dependent protease
MVLQIKLLKYYCKEITFLLLLLLYLHYSLYRRMAAEELGFLSYWAHSLASTHSCSLEKPSFVPSLVSSVVHAHSEKSHHSIDWPPKCYRRHWYDTVIPNWQFSKHTQIFEQCSKKIVSSFTRYISHMYKGISNSGQGEGGMNKWYQNGPSVTVQNIL